MRKWLVCAALCWLIASVAVRTQTEATPQLGPPVFHHVHVSSMNPSATIAAYIRIYPAVVKTQVAGFDGVKSGDVYVLLTKANTPPRTQPQSAFWHQVWDTPDVRQFALRVRDAGMAVLPLYTSDEGGTVEVSSDAVGYGLTKAGLEDAKKRGLTPTHKGGLVYAEGPDGVLMEVVQGAGPVDRLSGMDLWEEDPICAEFWYKKHFNTTQSPFPSRGGPCPTSEADCKVPRGEPSWPSPDRRGLIRVPDGWAGFNGFMFHWYAPEGDRPLVSTRGQFADHIALSVDDLDRWIAKLKGENVTFLRQPYTFGNARAVMIEGPSLEAIEIIERK